MFLSMRYFFLKGMSYSFNSTLSHFFISTLSLGTSAGRDAVTLSACTSSPRKVLFTCSTFVMYASFVFRFLSCSVMSFLLIT